VRVSVYLSVLLNVDVRARKLYGAVNLGVCVRVCMIFIYMWNLHILYSSYLYMFIRCIACIFIFNIRSSTHTCIYLHYTT